MIKMKQVRSLLGQFNILITSLEQVIEAQFRTKRELFKPAHYGFLVHGEQAPNK